MVIETKDLGFVDIDDREIIRFPMGIYGFENARRFVLLKDNSRENPFMWLQCADSRKPCFIVIDPRAVYSGYEPKLTAQTRETVHLASDDALRLLVIATVPKKFRELYVNLKCPVVINSVENIACQAILEDDAYPIRYPFFKEAEG